MRLPRLTGIALIASLLAVFLLCLGSFLYPSQVTPPSTGSAYSLRAVVETPGGAYATAVGHLAVSIEETESGNKSPVNAGYLTALLLTVFWVVLGLLFGAGRWWRRDRGFLLNGRRLPSFTCSDPRGITPSLLSVFVL